MQYYKQDDSIDNLEIICKRINSIRRDRGMTQKQFAEALEISQSAVSKYLSGRMPPADVMLKIARLGYTNVEWILTGKIPPHIVEEHMTVSEENSVYTTSEDFYSSYNNLPAPVQAAMATIINYFRDQRR